MSREHLDALEGIAVPDLDGVVAQSRDDLLIVVLEAVDALGILAAAVYSLEVEDAVAPVVVDALDVARDLGEEIAIEAVVRMVLAQTRLEQEVDPGKRWKNPR